MSPDSEDSRTTAVASICIDAIGEAPLSIRPIVGGLVNAVFDVKTRQAQLIFRVQFDRHHLVGVFRKEEWCMERARAVGVPGPEAVAVGIHGLHAYAVHTKLPGVVGSRYAGDIDQVWRRIGRHACRFHQVKALGFGEHLGGPVGESPDTTLHGWVDWWDGFVFGTPLLVDRNVLSARAFDEARAILSQIGHWSGEPRLCHGNLALGNVIVDESGEVFILDWGNAAGHLAPEFDVAELHAWSLDPEPPGLRAFLDGYGLSTSECEAKRDSLKVLQLWRSLSSARWMLENDRAQPGSIEFLRSKLRTLIAPFT